MTMGYGNLDPGRHHPHLGRSPYKSRGKDTWNGVRLAGRSRRLLALGVDVAVIMLAEAILYLIHSDVVVASVLVLNHLVLQTRTGRSVGKWVTGVHLIRIFPMGKMPARQSLSWDWMLWRLFLHIADLFGGFLLLLVTPKRQMVADAVTGALCVLQEDFDRVVLMQPVN